MDHAYIDEHDIANRYVMRTLSEAQTAEYEAHFIDCAECLDRVREIEELRGALKHIAVADADARLRSAQVAHAPAVHAVPRRQPLSRWLAGIWMRPAFAAAAVLVAVGAAAYFALAMSTARRDLAASRASAAQLQQQQDEMRASILAMQKRLVEAELKDRVDTVASNARGRSGSVLPVFSLVLVRGAESSSPPNRISLSPSQPWAVLSLELPDTSDFAAYSATLERIGGAEVWSQADLRPTSPGTLAIALSTDMLTAADYRLTLTGRTRAGRDVVAGRYPFRVVSR